MKSVLLYSSLTACLMLAGCGDEGEQSAGQQKEAGQPAVAEKAPQKKSDKAPAEKEGPKPAEAATKESNQALKDYLPFSDNPSFELANKGFIAPLPQAMIKGEDGNLIWDPAKYDFIKEGADAPDTVNPSLWRQSQLLNISGLFEVTEGIYQVRNQDLSNMTIVEGDKGLTIMDPLISAETAKVALDLYYEHRPEKPVVAVIYTHSHVDHYGGVRGVVDEADVKAGKVEIYAPVGFLEAAVAENVMAGNVMSRRASYMYGNLLPPSEEGQVGAGLGQAQRRLGAGEGLARGGDFVARHGAVIDQRFAALQVDARLFEVRLGGGELRARLHDVRAPRLHLGGERFAGRGGLTEAAARLGQIGLRLRHGDFHVGGIELDEDVALLDRLRVADQHFDRLRADERRHLRHFRVHIGIVGADMVAAEQQIPGAPQQGDDQHEQAEPDQPFAAGAVALFLRRIVRLRGRIAGPGGVFGFGVSHRCRPWAMRRWR